jgi:hypothetical protein
VTHPSKITQAQRDSAGETARRLHDEKLFGGAYSGAYRRGIGRRKHSPAVPRRRMFIAVVEAVEKHRGVPGMQDVRKLLWDAHSWEIVERAEVAELLNDAFRQAVRTGALPRKAYIDLQKNVELMHRGGPRVRPITRGEKQVDFYMPEVKDWLGYDDGEILDALVLMSNTYVFATPASQRARAFVIRTVDATRDRIIRLLDERLDSEHPELLPARGRAATDGPSTREDGGAPGTSQEPGDDPVSQPRVVS